MSEPFRFEAEMTVRAQMQARAEHDIVADKVFARHRERSWTYRQWRDESTQMAHFLLRRLGAIDDARPGHVAMLLDNHLELLSLYGGCAVAGLTLFGINTGLRGETLSGVIRQSRSRVLVVGEDYLPEVERVRGDLDIALENILVLSTTGGPVDAAVDLVRAVNGEAAAGSPEMPDVQVTPETNLIVIYTSGTTGLPKGINNSHAKLCIVGFAVAANVGLHQDDVCYISMPLFHSNSMFVGLMPAFWSAAQVGLRERFSASHFVPDILEYGATSWNYVGEPVHYVTQAIERSCEGDAARIRKEVTENPRNRMRYSIGNGASPPDIDKLVAYLGLDDMFEFYGSTEAAISTFRRRGDPRGSVGEVTDPVVKILNEQNGECPPAELDAQGKIVNYDVAVGEICRVAPETGLFQGYFDDESANAEKYRDGTYHSGDLGHVLMHEGKRYLYFDGRTDDWIRKDGENFSALPVARLLSEHPDVPLAAAYGVPCAVSDELVMAALKLHDGARFDPQDFFDFCRKQISDGGMNPRWMPDFIRIVQDFEYTGTTKILVRQLKAVHFDLRRLGEDPVYWRERGDTTYKPFTRADFDQQVERFRAAERLELLEH
ncbi:MAG: AMP-binding protein [Myxococcota bacterium]